VFHFCWTSLGLNQFLAFYTRFKKHFRTLEVVSGVLVLGIGVLIFTGQMHGHEPVLSVSQQLRIQDRTNLHEDVGGMKSEIGDGEQFRFAKLLTVPYFGISLHRECCLVVDVAVCEPNVA
jgi:hypothetical protein